jgi:tRNA uridine 5-carboxymethylaminomethyl modification enzyme
MDYDVVVIGGGHAGSEAATLAARRGAQTLLLTQNLETIGQMSCNPAIGGIAKGTVVREVDALGGVMGRATDSARIQFRMLNRSKGPAVWSPRAQCDRNLYRRAVRRLLEEQPRLHQYQGTVARLLLSQNCIAGVETLEGQRFATRAVVLTTGTFLRGTIHQGRDTRTPAGRAGDPPAVAIAEHLNDLGFRSERFKTGTPPRVDGRTVRVAELERQDGDMEPFWFSFYARVAHPDQRPCYLTYTGPALQAIVERHLSESALYGGAISSRGPRYCPSIEDKIVKFPSAGRHQVFLEPEGLDTAEMYVNGISTSLPPQVQLEMLHSIPGLEEARMTRAGYAIEYDYYPPTQLTQALESKAIQGLFMAGQVNGTTGYEEAAGQGAVAGLNAAARALDCEMACIGRQEAFLGVLVDDLVTRGVDEPYRLFTSRSEFRLLLRQDNALRRLFPLAERLKLLSSDELKTAEARLRIEEGVQHCAESVAIAPSIANPILARHNSSAIREALRVAELARRPEVPLGELLEAVGIQVSAEATVWADIEFKYAGYLAKEHSAAERLARMDEFPIPVSLQYGELTSLSFEARQKLSALRPASIGQARRIPGVSPSDIHCLVGAIIRGQRERAVSRETAG